MWQRAKIVGSEQAAEDIKSIVVRPEHWTPHKAGQHYELRMPGSEFMRKYSVVSSPSRGRELEFGVQLIPGGVLSPKLWAADIDDEIEIQGPWGESFIWEPRMSGPLVLLGAGSGITPLLSICDAYHDAGGNDCTFIMSAKNERRVMRYESLRDSLVTRFTEQDGRISEVFLKEYTKPTPATLCYICGPDGFIDDMVDFLIELGFPEVGIKSERFI